MNALILVGLVAVIAVVFVDAHGRMWEPAGRGTEWRRGYIVTEAKKDYNDMARNCGGKTVQWQQNGGQCGVCGDNWADPEPRDHEDGGKYDNGYITGTYQSGQVIEIQHEITANHLGWIEFRLCARVSRNTPLTHECLDQHVLENVNGETRFWIGSAVGVLIFNIQLPVGVTCTHCVIQWKYNTGNDWGVCPNGTGMAGCSDTPEQFYSCADVVINSTSKQQPPSKEQCSTASNNSNNNSTNQTEGEAALLRFYTETLAMERERHSAKMEVIEIEKETALVKLQQAKFEAFNNTQN